MVSSSQCDFIHPLRMPAEDLSPGSWFDVPQMLLLQHPAEYPAFVASSSVTSASDRHGKPVPVFIL